MTDGSCSEEELQENIYIDVLWTYQTPLGRQKPTASCHIHKLACIWEKWKCYAGIKIIILVVQASLPPVQKVYEQFKFYSGNIADTGIKYD